MARSTSSSPTSLWVTMRMPPLTARARMPFSFIFSSIAGTVIDGWSKPKMMMSVSTEAGSILTPGSPLIPRASFFARAWSSLSRSTISVRAMMPGAARTPTWRMPPPRAFLSRRPNSIRSRFAASIEPTGAESPLDRQNCKESTCFANSLTGTPEATLALKIRAPSRWTLSPFSSAIFLMALKLSSGTTAPPQLLWVFSRQMSVVWGVWTFGLRMAAATSFGSIAPRSDLTGRGVTPEMKVMWVDSML